MSAAVSTAIRNQVETALALRSTGRLEEALDVLTTPDQNISDFYTVRGEIQLALGRFHEAAGSFFTVVASEPENTFAHHQLAICLYCLKRWPEAAQAFERVLQLDPHRDQARLGLASTLLHLGRAEEALANYDLCWSDAARGRALFGKGAALQLLGRFEEASSIYNRLLVSRENIEEVLTNLITMSTEAQDLEAVQGYSRRLLEASPKSIVALQGLAAVAIQQRRYELAVQYCGRIVEQAPDCMEAWHNLQFATSQVMSALQQHEPPPAGRA